MNVRGKCERPESPIATKYFFFVNAVLLLKEIGFKK